jgi:hypothetical protein
MVKGYLNVYCPQHPNVAKSKMFPVHRLIYESYIGRYLLGREHIHHKNRNKLDNRIQNLELLSINEHRRLHAIEDSPNRGIKKYPNILQKVIEMRLDDKYAFEIAKKLNVPRRTIQRYLAEAGLAGKSVRLKRMIRTKQGRFL